MEKEYIVKYRQELTDKEFKLDQKEREIKDASKIFTDIEREREIIRNEKEQMAKQLKQVEALNKEKENIEHLRGMLERDAVIDRERKKMLNQQEVTNLQEKERLQKVAESLQR